MIENTTELTPRWTIYQIKRRSDGRSYVGLTKRSLTDRIAAHDHLARLRPHLGGPDTLASAIRSSKKQGKCFASAFDVRELATTDNPAEARRLERIWIARLRTAFPCGFNLMPGGASLGGPANALPITVHHPERGKLRFTSIMAAVETINRDCPKNNREPLSLYGVYARLRLGWSIEEALGLVPHLDGRRKRPLFVWRGRTYSTIRELADAENLNIDTVRSRLHRSRSIAGAEEHDHSIDRRTSAAKAIGLSRPTSRLRLPHPTDPRSPTISAEQFAEIVGIPKSTIIWRGAKLREASDLGMPVYRRAAIRFLTRKQERRILLTLTLPDGSVAHGGVRELVKRVLGCPAIADARPEQIGASAIRARLRRLPGWPNQVSGEALSWAFGLQAPSERTRCKLRALTA